MSLKSAVREHAPVAALRAYREASMWLRLLRSGNLQFLRFALPGHYYSPIPDTRVLGRDASRIFPTDATEVAGVDLRTAAQLDLARRFGELYDELPFPTNPEPGVPFYLDNEWFSYGDAIALYGILRTYRPRRIVEVGSGFSSAAMLEVDRRFLGRATEFTFIEPDPVRLQSLLTPEDRARCRIVEGPVQNAPDACFTALAEGDVLVIDSSHAAKAGSDVNHLFFHVLPLLASGVVIHFHDIGWPFEYPRSWFEYGRAWNEAYLLRAFLQYNEAFEVLYYPAYLAAVHGETLRALMPLAMEEPSHDSMMGNSSIWLLKR